jgi:Bacterial Ig-like domain (group 1)/PKD domain
MLTAFMVSRPLRRWLATAVLAGLSLTIGACQKVPLLAPSGSTITLTAGSTALSVNGTTDIVAQVVEAAGTAPQDGTLVTFTTTLGSIEPLEARTNGGRVTVKFRAGTANGTAIITASSGGASASGTNAARVAVGTAAVGSVRVSANPTLLPATGGLSTITGTVIDINGNPLSSAPVTFTTTAGSLEQVAVSTDANGVATAVLRATTTATITVAVGAQAGSSTGGTTPPAAGAPAAPAAPATTGTASGTVTVNVSSAPTLTITPPATAPSAGLPASYTFAVAVPATNGSAIRNVTVNWGDGQTQDLGILTGTANVSHVYRSSGTFDIVGTVTDSFGNVVKNSISVSVNPKPQPAVSITATTANPVAGVDMIFTASIAPVAGNGTVIQSATVNFDDGTTTNLGAVTGTAITLHHVYKDSNTYTVTLTATDSNGGVGTAVTTVFVQTATPLTVLLSATPTPAGANTSETFTATVIGLGNSVVVNYFWDFKGTNGTASTASNVQTRSYVAGSGPFTVTVTVTTSTGLTATGSVVITP